jgi:hypothetical protein
MSHSQFHSTNLFILGHAWLNLWDKHMTTGRINQVTTFPESARYSVSQSQPFSGRSSSSDSTRLQLQKSWLPCPPDLTLFRRISLPSLMTERNGLQRGLPAVSKWWHSLDHGGSSIALVANRSGHRQAVHIPSSSLCASIHCSTLFFFFLPLVKASVPFQISISLEGKAPLIWHRTSQSSLLVFSKAYSIEFQPLQVKILKNLYCLSQNSPTKMPRRCTHVTKTISDLFRLSLLCMVYLPIPNVHCSQAYVTCNKLLYQQTLAKV